jgi:hypothetical protein
MNTLLNLLAASSLYAGHFQHPFMMLLAHFLSAPLECTAHPGLIPPAPDLEFVSSEVS